MATLRWNSEFVTQNGRRRFHVRLYETFNLSIEDIPNRWALFQHREAFVTGKVNKTTNFVLLYSIRDDIVNMPYSLLLADIL